MFKIPAMLVVLIVGLIVSGYFAFISSRPNTVKIPQADDKLKSLLKDFNKTAIANPSPEMNALVRNVNWILENNKDTTLHVKRVLHQDLKSLNMTASLMDTMLDKSRIDFDEDVSTVLDRTYRIKEIHDKDIQDQINILQQMIRRGNK